MNGIEISILISQRGVLYLVVSSAIWAIAKNMLDLERLASHMFNITIKAVLHAVKTIIVLCALLKDDDAEATIVTVLLAYFAENSSSFAKKENIWQK